MASAVLSNSYVRTQKARWEQQGTGGDLVWERQEQWMEGKKWKHFSWRHIASKGYGCPYWHFHADFEDNKTFPLLCLSFTVKNFKPTNKFFHFHSIWLSGMGITVYGVRKAMDTENGRNALFMILSRASASIFYVVEAQNITDDSYC